MDKSMSKEDAILWIKNIINDIGSPRHSDLWGYEEALYEIQKLLKEDSAQQWIPCSERLPEKDGWYLVSLGNEWTSDGFGKVTDPQKVYNSMVRLSEFVDGRFYHGMVTAWMEKPEPYKGENAND